MSQLQCLYKNYEHICFSTFWGSRHPLGLKKIGMSKMTNWGTLINKAIIENTVIAYNYMLYNIWRQPWHLLMALLCAAALWLGITDLSQRYPTLKKHSPQMWRQELLCLHICQNCIIARVDGIFLKIIFTRSTE